MRRRILKTDNRFASVRFVLLLVLMATLTGCKVKRPNTVLAEDQMQEIVYDLQIARAMSEQLPYTENYKKRMYLDYVYSKHGVTEAKFDSSMVWYTRHTDALAKLYQKVAERLKREQTAVNDRLAAREGRTKITPHGDSIDVWMWSHVDELSGSLLNNRLSFTLPVDSNFAVRDSLVWQIQYRFLNSQPDSIHAPYMAMQLQLSTDSVIADIRRVYTDGEQIISLQPDTALALKEIRGFVYYPASVGDSLPSLLLHDIRLMRYHAPVAKDSLAVDSLQNNVMRTDTLKVDSVKEGSSVEKESALTDVKGRRIILSKPQREMVAKDTAIIP